MRTNPRDGDEMATVMKDKPGAGASVEGERAAAGEAPNGNGRKRKLAPIILGVIALAGAAAPSSPTDAPAAGPSFITVAISSPSLGFVRISECSGSRPPHGRG